MYTILIVVGALIGVGGIGVLLASPDAPDSKFSTQMGLAFSMVGALVLLIGLRVI